MSWVLYKNFLLDTLDNYLYTSDTMNEWDGEFLVEVKLPKGGIVTQLFMSLNLAKNYCKDIFDNGFEYIVGHGHAENFQPREQDIKLYEKIQKEYRWKRHTK